MTDAAVFKIEKDVPLAPHGNSRGGNGQRKYPVDQMSVGDSFFVPLGTRTHVQVQSAIQRAVNRYGAHGKYTTRKVEGGVRVWRIA